MTDRRPDTEITAWLQRLWTAELARADADYPAVPTRTRTHVQMTVPTGLVALGVVVLALAIVLRPGTGGPHTGDQGISLGGDGLPVAIGGESVLRGAAITTHLAEGSTTAFLAGGRLVVDGTGCPQATPAGGASCTETWQLQSVDGSGPAFTLDGIPSAAGFVGTSGVLTVVRVQPVERSACGSAACASALFADEVVWRAPTKGRIPSNASSSDGSQIYGTLWPDFIATVGRQGTPIVGYVRKEYLLHQSSSGDSPMPVYGEDLRTLVGYQVAGEGFVPIEQYQPTPPPSAPPVDTPPLTVLTAYLEAVEARNCPAALIVATTDVVPTTNALCSSTARVTAFEVSPAPEQPSDGIIVFSVAMTTTGGAFKLTDGPHAWSYTLTRQGNGAWRVSGAGPGP